jgi:hypothetical protein
LFHDFGNVVVLEEADGGDACGSCGHARVSIVSSDSAQGQDWDLCDAGVLKSEQACGLRAFFFEDWGEDGEGCVGGSGLGYFRWRVTRDSDQGFRC